jgi:hypothetical protein
MGKDYFKGANPDGTTTTILEHQTQINLKDFKTDLIVVFSIKKELTVFRQCVSKGKICRN